jgi:hypothetical protein
MELGVGLWNERLRVFYYGCKVLEELRIRKLGGDEF